jgi:hypothetical protein
VDRLPRIVVIDMNLINNSGIISVGDRVAYPGRASSSLWLNFGTVQAITEGTNWRGMKFTRLKVLRDGDSNDQSWRSVPVATKPRLVTITRTDYVVKVF